VRTSGDCFFEGLNLYINSWFGWPFLGGILGEGCFEVGLVVLIVSQFYIKSDISSIWADFKGINFYRVRYLN
jgi:hypothetical protein